MKEWAIPGLARALAEQMCEQHWQERMDADSGPKRIAVDDLITKIEANIRSLTAMDIIHPFTAPDGTHRLTRTDSETVFRFVHGDDQSKRDFSENFAKWKDSGLCTLNQAADVMARDTGEQYEGILERLMEAAYTCALPTYVPGSRQPVKYEAGRSVRETDETSWVDLNSWLADTDITFRFLVPPQAIEEAKKIKAANHRGVLAAPIIKAIKRAANSELNTVWLELRELALNGEPPFTGECKNEKLAYTNAKNELKWFTKKKLGQRFTRRSPATTTKRAPRQDR